MVKNFTGKFLLPLLALFLGGVFVISSVYSYSASEKINKEVGDNLEIVYSSLERDKVLNASYSAIPDLKEEIVSQKGFSQGLVTQKGDHLLVLVNKSISLPSNFKPSDLVQLNKIVPSAFGAQLRSEAASHLVEMVNAAKLAGYSLTVTSAYRSYENQVATFNYWVKQLGWAAAIRVSAEPGHSQHQLGTAVDFSSSSVNNTLTEEFGATAEGGWLEKNSWKYGFVISYPKGKEHITGYAYEPWHFRYIGVEQATKMRVLGWDLETFLQKYGVW